MPIGGRPFLDFVLSSLADAGCRDVGLVIGPDQRGPFLEYLRRHPTTRTHVELLEQAEPLGTADAVVSAARWVGAAPFLVVNSDNLYPVDALRDLIALDGPGLAVFDREELVRSSNIPAERVAAFALVDVDRDGYLSRIIEKPGPEALAAAGAGALISMNSWRFDRGMVDVCREVPLSSRGEYELPHAVALAIARGVRVKAIRARGEVLDLSQQTDVAEVSRRLAGIDPRP